MKKLMLSGVCTTPAIKEKNFEVEIFSYLFSFIAGVVDTPDNINTRIFHELKKNWNCPDRIAREGLMQGKLIHEKKLEAENLMSESL